MLRRLSWTDVGRIVKETGKQRTGGLALISGNRSFREKSPPLFRKGSQETRLCLEIFWYLVRIAIQSLEQKNGTIVVLSRCEIESRLIHHLPIIYEHLRSLKKRTACYTRLRMNSWLKRDYRLRRIFSQMETGSYIHERDKNGNVIDSALRRPGTFHLSNPMESSVNPEGDLIEKEENGILDRIVTKLGSGGRKHESVYRTIMKMLLEGIDVGEEHAGLLGVKSRQVVPLKHQTRILARKIAAEEDPGVADKINHLMNQAKKRRNLKKIIERLYPFSSSLRIRSLKHSFPSNF
jgi:hypothetical protein